MVISLVAAQAATLTVGQGGHPDIKSAVAASAPGDTILLEPDFYAESVTIPHPLVIRGKGPGVAIAPFFGAAIRVQTGAALALEELTVAGATCAVVEDRAHLELRQVQLACGDLFTTGTTGASVTTTGTATLLIRDSSMGGSPAQQVSGIEAGGPVHILDSTFSGAASPKGGVLLARGGLIVSRSLFAANVADSEGGAIAAIGGDVRIVGSSFYGNQAPEGGALAIRESSTFYAAGNTFCDNRGSAGPGVATVVDVGTMRWTESIAGSNAGDGTIGLSSVGEAFFHYNAFADNAGPVIGQTGQSFLELSGSWFAFNGSPAVAHGLWNESYNLFHDNGVDAVPGPLAPTTVTGDPLVIGIPPAPDASACDALPFRISSNSPLRGAGPPTSNGPTDIGPSGLGDGDGDGTPDDLDCGDASQGFHVPEICGNGIDDNCDGLIDDGPFVLESATWGYVDEDGDGFGAGRASLVCAAIPVVANGDDCDDADAQVHPGALEVCNGIDDDCDGQTPDPGVPGDYLPDADGDGYGDETAVPVYACDPSAGVLVGGDCDDTQHTIAPDADEICNGIDDDCDDQTDEDLDYVDHWRDGDGDGLGRSTGDVRSTCDGPPQGFVDNADDCDDTDPAVGGPMGWTPDADADGFGDLAAIPVLACDAPAGHGIPTDCNDALAAVNPTTLWYADADGDGAGDATVVVGPVCVGPAGYVTNATDCDDMNDEVAGDTQRWTDADGDGWGAGSPQLVCGSSPGFVDNDLDCDDTDASVSPDSAWYPDGDGDGFGTGVPTVQCVAPGMGAWSLVDGDCDDADASRNPDSRWYPDVDQDGVGGGQAVIACTPPAGHVQSDDDCDAADPAVGGPADRWFDADGDSYGTGDPELRCPSPGWVTADGDCDDDDASRSPDSTWYPDTDDDGFGDEAVPLVQCEQPAGHVADGTDCDDTTDTVRPGVDEVCNGVDDDCDGTTDVDPTDGTMYFADDDGDTYGDLALAPSCAPPANGVLVGGDCNDADPAIFPGATETCNGLDDDCNDLADDGAVGIPWFEDADDDGVGAVQLQVSCLVVPGAVTLGGDCDDTTADRSPLVDEICDGIDNDCDQVIDDGVTIDAWPDADADGYGDAAVPPVSVCALAADQVANGDDCDDTDPAIRPDATEIPGNGIDEDCDGVGGSAPVDSADTADTGVRPPPTRAPTPPPQPTIDPITPPVATPVVPTPTAAPPATPVEEPATALWYCSARGAGGTLWVGLLTAALVRRRRS